MKLKRLEFSRFVLNENKDYLGNQVGTVLGQLQELAKDAPNMGKRHLIRTVLEVVRGARAVLKGRWTYEDVDYLKPLQKVGVALMKGVDTNDDLVSIINSSVQELEKLSEKIQAPMDNLGKPAFQTEE